MCEFVGLTNKAGPNICHRNKDRLVFYDVALVGNIVKGRKYISPLAFQEAQPILNSIKAENRGLEKFRPETN